MPTRRRPSAEPTSNQPNAGDTTAGIVGALDPNTAEQQRSKQRRDAKKAKEEMEREIFEAGLAKRAVARKEGGSYGGFTHQRSRRPYPRRSSSLAGDDNVSMFFKLFNEAMRKDPDLGPLMEIYGTH